MAFFTQVKSNVPLLPAALKESSGKQISAMSSPQRSDVSQGVPSSVLESQNVISADAPSSPSRHATSQTESCFDRLVPISEI